MKKILRYLKYTLNIVLGFALIVSVLLLVFSFKSPFRSLYIYKVMSGSMEPAIHTGSIVITEVANPSQLKVGDVISYTMKNDETVTVTHRLVSVSRKSGSYIFRTKGDANKTADLDDISQNRLKGKVILTVPLLGYFFEWVKTPMGFIFAVVVPALYILTSEAFVMKKIFERSAVEKYKHEEEMISKYLVLLIFCSVLFSFGIGKTQSYFSGGAMLSNVSISTGIWSLPCRPDLLTPEDHSLAEEGSVSFSWSVCTADVTYSLEFADNNDFKKIYDTRDGLSTGNIAIDIPHGSYWWHVKACSQASCSDWSEAQKITVVPVENKQTVPSGDHLEPTLELSYFPDLHEVHYLLRNVGDYGKLQYELTYRSDGMDEGAKGKENIKTGTFEGVIYLGTCSDGDCTPHLNITDIELSVYLDPKNGNDELLLKTTN